MSRFKEIYSSINSGIPYNLHGHTQYCDGRATMEEFASAAAVAGMSHYGFSPHSPLPISSPCNMAAGDVKEYLQEVENLHKRYEGRVEILASMEIDYLGKEWGPSYDYFQSLPLDYRIGSVHFITNQDGEYIDVDGSAERFARYLKQYFRNDLRYVVETFYSQSLQMVDRGGFDIIGHFDKIAYNASTVEPDIEHTDWYRALVTELIDNIIAKGIAVEINTKAYAANHRFFPSPVLWPRIVSSGIPIVVNSDAHYPERINASRQDAFELLASISVKS